MLHPVVEQLQFARSEWLRGFEGVTDEEARRRFLPMNSLSWIVGHLAAQEHRYFGVFAQGLEPLTELDALVGHGRPASTPPLDQMWDAWRLATATADDYLARADGDTLQSWVSYQGKPVRESIGTLVRRVTYHYWYHLGEAQAIRQLLGHRDLPEYVGDLGAQAPYRPE